MEEGVQQPTTVTERKSFKKVLVILIGVLVLSIIGSSIYIWYTTGSNPVSEVSKEVRNAIRGFDPEDDGFDTDPPRDEKKTFPPTSYPSGGAGSGGGGADGGSDSSSTSSGGTIDPSYTCYHYLLSYSLTGRNVEEDCTNFDINDLCTEKEVVCTINVNNDDLNHTGHFDITIFFLEKGVQDSSQAFYSIPNQFPVSPDSSLNLKGTTVVTGELATKQMDCYFTSQTPPYWEECFPN